MSEFAEDKQAYADIADELNDPDCGMTIDELDDEAVELARQYAKRNKLRFPPKIGDYDRFWEREQGTRRAGDL